MAARSAAATAAAASRVRARQVKTEKDKHKAQEKHDTVVALHADESAGHAALSERIAGRIGEIPDDDPVLVERVAILLLQLPEDGPIKPSDTMVIPGEKSPGTCLSCGCPVEEQALPRCAVCIKAYRMAYAQQLEVAILRERAIEVDDDFTLSNDF